MRIKKYISKEKLYKLYVIKKLTSMEISKILNVSEGTISIRLKENNIITRSNSESHKLYYISSKKGKK